LKILWNVDILLWGNLIAHVNLDKKHSIDVTNLFPVK
jgi:hypothetical protein